MGVGGGCLRREEGGGGGGRGVENVTVEKKECFRQ